MQQVRTHFSTAYELPLLTRAENYAQVSPLAQLSPVTPISTAGAGRRRARPRSLSLAVGDLECWGSVLCCGERLADGDRLLTECWLSPEEGSAASRGPWPGWSAHGSLGPRQSFLSLSAAFVCLQPSEPSFFAYKRDHIRVHFGSSITVVRSRVVVYGFGIRVSACCLPPFSSNFLSVHQPERGVLLTECTLTPPS